ncbi:hypothetical protein BR93DRAFT_559963 [Coniochaeta sp. PMI_546]|nr:hypothetical protein BR93DRAFT_559963 [Coniochaeta sp. PMI_546]
MELKARLELLHYLAMHLVPLYLLGWTLLTTWTVVVDLCVFGIFAPLSQQRRFGDVELSTLGELTKGACIVLLFVLLKATWIGAWAFARSAASSYQERSPSAKKIMHIDQISILKVLNNQLVNHRFRSCGRCETTMPLGDRMYHDRTVDVHYPVYDHHCYWLHLPVFLHTIKPYLILCAALSLDALFVLGTSIYAAATTPATRQHVAVAFVSFVLFARLSFGTTIFQWHYLAVRNTPLPERRKLQFCMVRWLDVDRVQLVKLGVESGEKKWRFNPWELGRMENFREAMGYSAWTWFLFWRIPERVVRWDADASEESDFRLGDLWQDFVAGRPTSRENYTWEYLHPAVLPQTHVVDAADVPTTLLPSAWISRRRGARSTGVDIEMV